VGLSTDSDPARARLRDIQTITDAELSRPNDHDFLTELLVRAPDILRADTAAVLRLDSPAGQPVAAAARLTGPGWLPRGTCLPCWRSPAGTPSWSRFRTGS
jgi:hypothetical protein